MSAGKKNTGEVSMDLAALGEIVERFAHFAFGGAEEVYVFEAEEIGTQAAYVGGDDADRNKLHVVQASDGHRQAERPWMFLVLVRRRTGTPSRWSHHPAGSPRGSGNGERPATQTFASH